MRVLTRRRLVRVRAQTWATCYGASFAGRYGGQRGDGRAVSVGIADGRYEVQLKGAGVTPYSRRFDGRAVLRSCIREFLASEAMHHLRVPTTRALAVVTTGETISRAWYDAESGYEKMVREPGAVGSRVASSFLRFGQMELFHQRGDDALLAQLAEHALRREFGHLMVQHPSEPLASQLVRMFEEVCERQARLVAEWLRVGYCQGNMNSDNSALAGFTLDYGPFGFMEKFQPMWNPWVGGGMPYAFGRQPNAAAVNLVGLSEAFVKVVEMQSESESLSGADKEAAVSKIRFAVRDTFVDTFDATHDDNCRRKLGLSKWDDEAQKLWDDLFGLMAGRTGAQGIDFTLFFRALSSAPPDGVAVSQPAESMESEDEAGTEEAGAVVDLGEAGEGALREVLSAGALEDLSEWPEEHMAEWREWVSCYWQRVSREEAAGHGADTRVSTMREVNPKYILRNWMAMEAYDAAERGDNDLVAELYEVLRKPYEDQGADVDAKWAQVTPVWARGRAGLAYLS